MTQAVSTSLEQLIIDAPSIAAEHPEAHVSGKYRFIRTVDMIPSIMDLGWVPVRAREGRVMADHRRGFQKHVVTFRRKEDVDAEHKFKATPKEHLIERDNGKYFFEMNITNSHDRTTAWSFFLGMFVQICANGLVVSAGSGFQSGRIKHINVDAAQIVETTKRAAESYEPVIQNVRRMHDIELVEKQRLDFAEAALMLKYGDMGRAPIGPQTLLTVRRKEDEGSDLWHTFNVIQENIMRGGQREDTRLDVCGRKYGPSCPIQRMDRQIEVNADLWKLASGYLN